MNVYKTTKLINNFRINKYSLRFSISQYEKVTLKDKNTIIDYQYFF